MTRITRRMLAALTALALCSSPNLFAQTLPYLQGQVHATAGTCVFCHEPGGMNPDAMTAPDGRDISPVTQWRSTMMANSFRDPYFQAKVSAEVATHSGLQGFIENECLGCHAPLGRGELQFADSTAEYSLAQAQQEVMAADGVSCTICHQIEPDNLGQPESWSGHHVVRNNRIIYGPYDNMYQQPMVTALAYLPVYGAHLAQSEACATCHTLFTPSLDDNDQIVGSFAEQTPYLEWLNSRYAAEGVQCQSCHMPDRFGSPTAISNRPVWLPEWAPYPEHLLVGGNVFMLQMLKSHGTELGVTATDAQFDSTIAITRRFLREATADLSAATRWDGDTLEVRLAVHNRTGHKFPTAYPSRRAWIELKVTEDGGAVRFHSGAVDAATGEVAGNDQPYEPHHAVIRDAGQVQIYQPILGDINGEATHGLLRANRYLKDNRIPPEGYTAAGLYADSTAVFGLATSDPDFNRGPDGEGTGTDTVVYRIGGLQPGTGHTVTALLHFQSVSPRAADYLFQYATPEVERFQRFWNAADRRPERIDSLTLAVTPTGIAPALAIPESPLLVNAWPNPFNPALTIAVTTASAGRLDVTVYNLLGERVALLSDGERSAGDHRLSWRPGSDGAELSSGLYLIRVTLRGSDGVHRTAVRKVMYLR